MATRVADLSVDELRTLIQEVVTQTIEALLRDPDEGLELREDIRSALLHSLKTVQAGDETLPMEEIGLANAIREGRKNEFVDEAQIASLLNQGVRGKYVQRFAQGSNVVVLSPDVAEIFPDSESVNNALRMLVEIAGKSTGKLSTH